jgi:uncharacterized protein
MRKRVAIAGIVAAVAVVLGAVVPSLAGPAQPTAPAANAKPGTSGGVTIMPAPAGPDTAVGSAPAGVSPGYTGGTVSILPAPIACPEGQSPCPPIAGAPGAENTVTVIGVGTVTSQPDEAVLGLGVRTQASDANDALKENASRMAAVMKALHDLGIGDADISTSSVSLYPNYSNDGSTITGYVAENDISVTVHDLAKVGSAIDDAVAAGANVSSGVTFQMSDANAGLSDALKQAVGNARDKAEALAGAAGAKLGGVVSITESGAPSPIPYGAAFDRAAGVATPINPGPVQIQVSVIVVWALQ